MSSEDDASNVAEGSSSTGLMEQFAKMQQVVEMQIKAMNLHAQMLAAAQPVQSTLAVPLSSVKQVKVPEGRYDMSINEFRTFQKDCNDYKTLTKYSDAQMVLQIRLHMDSELKSAVDANYRTEWDNFSLKDALEAVGTLINHISNPVVYRKEFDNLYQGEHETVREFVTKLRACAMDCNFVCPFDEEHNLTNYHITNKLRSGIFDKHLQQELLIKYSDHKDLNTIILFCEQYESAKKDKDKLSMDRMATLSGVNADDLSNVEIAAAISNYKKKKKSYNEYKNNEHKNNEHKKLTNQKKCNYCGYNRHSMNNCPAQGKTCNNCGGDDHFEQVCRAPKVEKKISSMLIISTIEKVVNSVSNTELPRLNVQIQVNDKAPLILTEVIADTGAQVCVAGPSQMKHLNIKLEQLREPSHLLKHAGGNPLKVLGSFPVTIRHNDRFVTEHIYFAVGVSNMYISFDTCKRIGLVHEQFPNVDLRSVNINTVDKMKVQRKLLLPTRPEQIPFLPTDENIPKLEQWLRDKFSATAFNITDPLPVMSGLPCKFHLKDDAVPYAAHTPIPIPHHWKKEVEKMLEDDVRMGILQRAPVGEPTEWCMRMVTVEKKNGEPRRTVDFQPINKYCRRETHHTPPPIDVVSNIPPKSYKTVLDAFNGYHQIPLDTESIQLTTFITEFGRFQYLRAPQGHIGSGDAYTRRYDDVIKDVKRKSKIVDDVLLYDADIFEAFYHVFDFLCLCSENGITINPTKFHFAKSEVDFVGFHIGWEYYRPTDEMLASIKDFPMPDEPSIVDLRSWFGLVNQLAPFLAVAPLMSPFRDILKSPTTGKKVYWDSQLQQIFNSTKSTISDIAAKGLSYYDVSKQTVVITDWSKLGIGFVIMQKHCECNNSNNVLCCDKGWKLSFCNSRHLTAAESNYAPIEGEALAVYWALKKAKIYLLGCPTFHVIVDHAPLVKIFGDKSLSEINNPRLFSFKEKTLPFSFKISYIKGINNHANVFSRYPVGEPDKVDIEDSNCLEVSVVKIALTIAASALFISLDEVRYAIQSDEQYKRLIDKVNNNSFATKFSLEDPSIKEFYNVKDRLSVSDGLLMYSYDGGALRLVIPTKLRSQMVDNMHSANQGSTSMLLRARNTMYWPGMDRSIDIHIQQCLQCRESAPSQTKEPLIVSQVPDYPYQQVVADLFEIEGFKYLVYADRLTGFVELAHFPASTVTSIVINSLREFFHRWGVPEEVSLDGGPNVDSNEITKWLKHWGVNVRKSSAYYPQSNGRAEAGVKSMKRLLKGNTGRRGSLNTDEVAQALLQYRNTPLRGVNKSPAELALGRQLRDTIPLPRERYKIDSHWAQNLRERERQMSKTSDKIKTKYDVHAKELSELTVGDHVYCQDVRSKKWCKSGVIVEVRKYRQYLVKMDGSGRISLRNRKHMRKIRTACLNVEAPSFKPNDQVPNVQDATNVNESSNQVVTPSLPNISRNKQLTVSEENILEGNDNDKSSSPTNRSEINEGQCYQGNPFEVRRSKRCTNPPDKFSDNYEKYYGQ